MKGLKPKTRANSGFVRILETVVAATIIFIVFAASAFLINSSQVKVVQEKSDLDRLGYNVLSRLIESGTIEATIDNSPTPLTSLDSTSPEVIGLKAFIQNSIPSSMLFNLNVTKWSSNPDKSWVTPLNLPPLITNSDNDSFSSSLAVSSTPLIYTSKNGNIYYLILVLTNAGNGT
jgi:hypothetical protein